jgi:hypothetical protein
MYDDLCKAIITAYPAIQWFAFRKAIDLAGEMAQVVGRYNDDKTSDEVRTALIKVGKDVSLFLRQNKQDVVPGAADELQTCLTAIEMEN